MDAKIAHALALLQLAMAHIKIAAELSTIIALLTMHCQKIENIYEPRKLKTYLEVRLSGAHSRSPPDSHN